MMRRYFWRGLGCAALAAVALPAVVMGLAPVFGKGGALALYLLAVCVSYLVCIAPNMRTALGACVVSLLVGAVLMCVLPDMGRRGLLELAVACAVLLAFCRSGLLYPSRSLRGVVLEVGLVLGGLLAAWLVSGPGAISLSLSVWAYLLVQSLYFLAPGMERRGPERGSSDPFERASSRLQSLLDQEA